VKITPVDVDNVDTATTMKSRAMTVSPQDDDHDRAWTSSSYWAGPQDDGAAFPDTTTLMLPDAALAAAAESAANDYPIATMMDDLELGDFLLNVMTAEDAERHTDALCIFEELSPPLVLMVSP
jgi:hypothetical protein